MEKSHLSNRDTAQLAAITLAIAGFSSCIDHAASTEPVVPARTPIICYETFERAEQLLRGSDRCPNEIYEMPTELHACRRSDPERVRRLIEAIDIRVRGCIEPQREPAIQMTQAHASRSHRPQNRRAM